MSLGLKKDMINLHGYGPSILDGTLVTITVSLVSLAISMLLGMVLSLIHI